MADLDSGIVKKVGLHVKRGQGVGLENEKAEMADHWLAESSFEPKVGGCRDRVPSGNEQAGAGTEMKLGFEPGVLVQWNEDVMG